MKSRKNFPVNLSPDKPETGFLFFRVVEEILFFCFFFSHCLNALSARKREKSVETSRICLFSLRKPLSAGKLGKSDKSGFTNSVFSGHSSKAEKSNSSFENLRGIVRPLKLSEVESLSKPQSLSMSKKRTVPQRFFSNWVRLFPFSTIGHNDRGYGLGQAAGEFPVAIATKEMRAQRLPEAH